MENIIQIETLEFNASNFLDDLSQNLRSKIYACVHQNGVVKIYTSEQITLESELNEINSIISSHRKTNKPKLRIFRVLPEDQNPLIADFSILGFRKMSPSYDRGKKTKALYKCVDKDEIVVEKIFQDVLSPESGNLIALQVVFNWYDEEGNIGLTKTEIVKNLNKFEAETEIRKRRYRQFDYLRASVKGTPYEFYIAVLITHFNSQIQKYKDDGLFNLHTDMLNEVDPQIRAILDSSIARNDGLGDTTVMKSMQYQIGTISIDEL